MDVQVGSGHRMGAHESLREKALCFPVGSSDELVFRWLYWVHRAILEARICLSCQVQD